MLAGWGAVPAADPEAPVPRRGLRPYPLAPGLRRDPLHGGRGPGARGGRGLRSLVGGSKRLKPRWEVGIWLGGEGILPVSVLDAVFSALGLRGLLSSLLLRSQDGREVIIYLQGG